MSRQPMIRSMMSLPEAKILLRRIKLQLLTPVERAALDRYRARLEAAIAGAGDEPPPGGMAA